MSRLTSHVARSPVGVGRNLWGAVFAVGEDGGGEEAEAGGD